jgi:hypothetical protein
MPLFSKKSPSSQNQPTPLTIKEIIHNWIADVRWRIILWSLLIMDWTRPIFNNDKEIANQQKKLLQKKLKIAKEQSDLNGVDLKIVEWVAFPINVSDEKINRTLSEIGVMKQRTKNILDKKNTVT